ncbi:YceI family protein [Niabella terrae]
MKKLAILVSAFFVLTAFTTAISNWKNDKAHSQLAFSVTHLGISDVSGTFNNFDVNVKGANKDFSDAVFELTADVASIDTRIQQRNDHLKSADFFEVEKYPTLHFKSTSIKKAGKNKYKLSGDLTIRDITRPVTMDLLYRGTIDQPQAKVPTAGFQLTGTIKRSDFNVGPKFPAAMISDEVRIKADGEFHLEK